ncbi:hypothetical protein FHL15_010629 [Xylaria flabelliformis]|uniref:F-box domain-containing protein n=1 Tax=Xylaria flabelliformis TaxID=2512241 RepID=A0A553HKH0_9PEZI|nr:hypothetical protein FHL15_010629 [Xylaria flabelliformis]
MSSFNRRATRASGRANLSGSMQDVIRDAKTTAMYERRAFREQKSQSERIPKFHSFMKLPLELRAHIYFLAMEDADSPRPLATLRAPTLALVSKQVQEEAMPVFLSQCTFYLEVLSKYNDVDLLGKKAANGTLWPLVSEYPRSCCAEEVALQSGGCKPLSKRTKSRLQKMQGNSKEWFFPHVELHIRPTECCEWAPDPQVLTLVLSLHACRGRLLLDYEDLENTDIQPCPDQVRMNAETVARDIAERHRKQKGFCGFRYEELDAIAKSFRYWSTEAPEF